MSTTDINNTLGIIIQQSHQVLSAVEEKRWDDLVDLETKRQVLFAKLQSSHLPNEASIIEGIETILSLNRMILSHSVGFQVELQQHLKNRRNQQTLNNAYKPLG